MEGKNLTPVYGDNKTFKWCGYEWESTMEVGRIIHPDLPWYWMDPTQVMKDDNDSLYLFLNEKSKTVKHWDGIEYHPYKAGGTMRSVQSFSYGTFSLDLKCPKGFNLWPSFWLSGDKNWPPEIDIMEAWSLDNNYFVWMQSRFPWFNPGWKTTNNIHYLDNNGDHTHIGSGNISVFKQPKNPTEHFVNYKVDWFPNEITFYVNNKIVRKITNEVCHKLVRNINHPDKGYNMDVIINVWCENPEAFKVDMETPLVVKNFKYEPY